MFSSVLIANRGEIACRIARTAKRLGMRTIAVYSAADARALHVRLCDEAHCIGPAEPRESYLSIERLIEAARSSGAACVHPGYGRTDPTAFCLRPPAAPVDLRTLSRASPRETSSPKTK